jgi:hypothetical protein
MIEPAALAERPQDELVEERAIPRRQASTSGGPAAGQPRAARSARSGPGRRDGGRRWPRRVTRARAGREARPGGEGGARHGPAALRLHVEQAQARARPAATTRPSRSTASTVPGGARRLARRLDARRRTLRSPPAAVVTVPGQGRRPRTRRAISSAGRVQSIRPSSFLGSARAWPRVVLGLGVKRAAREPVERLQQHLAPSGPSRASSSGAVSSGPIGVARASRWARCRALRRSAWW